MFNQTQKCAKIAKHPSEDTFMTAHPDTPIFSLEQHHIDRVQALVWDALRECGWVRVPREPTDALLLSIAVRFDHGLGVPGYYDAAFFRGGDGESHAEILERTCRLAGLAQRELLHVSLSEPLELLLPVLQERVFRNASDLPLDDVYRVVRDFVNHPDYATIPQTPLPEMIAAVSFVLERNAKSQGLPDYVSESDLRRLWDADARRVCEEVSGVGFYKPQQGKRPKATI